MSANLVYLDSSAIVKLVVAEAESSALRAYLATSSGMISSRLAWTEVQRAVARVSQEHLSRAQIVLRSMDMLPVDDHVLEAAGQLPPVSMRSLDAIHIASARALGDDLSAFVSYDVRQAAAARDWGMTVMCPDADVSGGAIP